jgi:hypothetical protein
VRELAEHVRELGFDGPGEKRIGQLEAGGRPGAPEGVRQRAENVRLREVIALAVALGPALGNMLALNVLADTGPSVRLGEVRLRPREYRDWVFGYNRRALGSDDPEDETLFTQFVPKGWLRHVEGKVGAPAWLGLVRSDEAERRAIVSGGTAIAEGDWTHGEEA